jgi:hypothetical protein
VAEHTLKFPFLDPWPLVKMDPYFGFLAEDFRKLLEEITLLDVVRPSDP